MLSRNPNFPNYFMYMEFNNTFDKLLPNVVVNTSVSKECITQIEWIIQRHREHSTIQIPKKLIIKTIIYFSVLCINSLPVNSFVSTTLTPISIVVYIILYWKNTPEWILRHTLRWMMNHTYQNPWYQEHMRSLHLIQFSTYKAIRLFLCQYRMSYQEA